MAGQTARQGIEKFVSCACVALAAFLASGCAAGPRELDETVLASVNGEPVTLQDIQEGFEGSHRGHTLLLAGSEAMREFLDKTVDRRLLIQEARRIGLDDDAGIREAVQDLVAQRARDELYADEVTRPVEASEEAIRAAYEKTAQGYRVRHILTYTREDAERAAARVRAGEAFGSVAAQVSVSTTAGKGGDLGLVGWGQMDPRLEAEVEAMDPGEVRGPIETDQGWNILLMEERRPLQARPELEKLRNQITAILKQRAISRRSLAFFDELRARWAPRVFHEALSEENLREAGQGGPEPDQAKRITVGLAGDRSITLADLRARLNLKNIQNLPRPWALRQVRGVLDEAIFASLLEQEALRRGYARRPSITREASRLEEGLLLDRLLATVVYPPIQITDEEVRAFYDQNPKSFTQAEAVRLKIIVLDPQQDTEPVLRELRTGADFEAVARTWSRDPITAQAGGDLGWVVRGTTNPAIEAVAFSLKAGEIGLAKDEKATFVLKVMERRPERLQEYAAVKEKARESLLTRRRRAEVQRWVARLREASEIVIEGDAIDQAVAAYREQARGKAANPAGNGHGKGP